MAKQTVERYNPPRTFVVESYCMRRGGRPQRASKVTCAKSGVVVMLTELMDADSAVEAAIRFLEVKPRWNGRSPEDIAARLRSHESSGDVVRAVKILLEELAAVVPEEWAFTDAIKAAVENKHGLRGG